MDKQSILVIDDEPAITQSLRRSLRENFEVFTANTILQAVDILQHHEIAVIITDQRMPDMQGVDFLHSAQQLQPNTRSILLSGYADVQALIAALNISTVRGFFPKPWDDKALLGRIDTAAKEYRALIRTPELLETSSAVVAELQEQINALKRQIDILSLGANEIEAQEQATDNPDASTDEFLRTEITNSNSPISARMMGIKELAEANPERYHEIKDRYAVCLEQAVEQKLYMLTYPLSNSLQNIANELGFLRAGPRDVIAIHNGALQTVLEKSSAPKRRVYLEESRWLIVELMGNLVRYYRSHYFLQTKEDFHAQ